jgi:hypothetical protein
MSKTKKTYKVVKPVVWGGVRNAGEILSLTDEEAKKIKAFIVEQKRATKTTEEIPETQDEKEKTTEEKDE